MKKFLASVAILAASAFAFNASASTNYTAATESKATETTVSPESKEESGCWICGTWYYYKNGKRYFGGYVRCCR